MTRWRRHRLRALTTPGVPLAAVATVRCGQEHHRVGVTTRGQAVMLHHDRRLESLAEGIEAEARTPCAELYNALRTVLAGAEDAKHQPGATRYLATGDLMLNGVAAEDTVGLDEYLDATDGIRTRRARRASHTVRLTQISVLGGGPPHLPDWARSDHDNPYRVDDPIRRQAEHKARQQVVERVLPELFLRAGYPIVARHPPTGPGVTRGACWHVTATDLGPGEDFGIATQPHPNGRGRVCYSVAVPLAPDWYRDVYKTGAAVVDGCLVCKLGEWGSGGAAAYGALLLVQHGARLRLEDHPVARGPAGWARVPRTLIGAGALGASERTGVRPSPWD